MKKPNDLPDLSDKLSRAAAAPLVQHTPDLRVVERPTKAKKAKEPTIPVFLRISPELHKSLVEEAKARDEMTTIQQVIIDRCMRAK